jgi:hypothetical protein
MLAYLVSRYNEQWQFQIHQSHQLKSLPRHRHRHQYLLCQRRRSDCFHQSTNWHRRHRRRRHRQFRPDHLAYR